MSIDNEWPPNRGFDFCPNDGKQSISETTMAQGTDADIPMHILECGHTVADFGDGNEIIHTQERQSILLERPKDKIDKWILASNDRTYYNITEIEEMLVDLGDQNIYHLSEPLIEYCNKRTYIDSLRVTNALLDMRNLTTRGWLDD